MSLPMSSYYPLFALLCRQSFFGEMWRRKQMYDDWLTKAETKERTGISERTLERLIHEDKVRHEYRRIPGRKPLTIIHPEDVAELEVKTAKMVPGSLPVPKPPVRDMAELLAALAPRLTIDKKLYLTLKEASEFSGLPITYLKRAIKEKLLPAVKIPHYRIRRDDLEAHHVTGGIDGIV